MTTEQMKWVKDLPVARRGRIKRGVTHDFVAILKTRPGVWAIYKTQPAKSKSKFPTTLYAKSHPGTEWATRTQGNKVVVYARYIKGIK